MIRVDNNFVSCGVTENLQKISELFLSTNTENVYILDGNKLVGKISKKHYIDLLRDQQFNLSIREMMEPQTIVIYQDQNHPIQSLKNEAIQIMLKNSSIQEVPVVNNNGGGLLFKRDIKDRTFLEKNLLTKYAFLLQAGYSVGDYLKANHLHSVIIYGADELALLLYNDISKYEGISIKTIVNHRKTLIGDMETISWNEMNKELTQSVDTIIVSYIHTYPVLNFNLQRVGIHNVISLETIVDKLFHYAQEIKPALDMFLKLNNSGVSFWYGHIPIADELKSPSFREQKLVQYDLSGLTARQYFDKYASILMEGVDEGCTREDLKEWCQMNIPLVYRNGYAINVDVQHKLYTILNGERVTTDVPKAYKRKVYFVGRSWNFSPYVADSKTVASQLQQKLNELCYGEYGVVNYGVNGMTLVQTVARLKDIDFSEGDIVIFLNSDGWLEEEYNKLPLQYIDLLEYLDRPHKYGEIYVDKGHFNSKGNDLIATALFEKIFKNNSVNADNRKNKAIEATFNLYCSSEKPTCMRAIPIDNTLENNKQFLDFIQSLYKYRVSVNGKIGSIVMNCNPFTKGHRYLIQTAASQVDHLYIFVVEEDKSVFKFKDRFELVKKGTADLPNVTVLPSGKFIISSITFPGYFVKGENNDAIVDTSQDLTLYAKRIAPALGITVRFAGTEPTDKVTRQYNEQMAKILPNYGIEFVEIPRVESKGAAISASKVRALLKEKKYDELKEIVPDTTYDYLIHEFDTDVL